MIWRRRKQGHGVSPAWISFADLFGQLMIIGLVLALFFWYRALRTEESWFTVTGVVTGLDPDESRHAKFLGEDREVSITKDNHFTFEDLNAGRHEFALRIPEREDVPVGFSVYRMRFDGLQVEAGRKTSAAENAGLVINPLTEDIVAFGTADYHLLSSGRRFLRNEFTRIGADGRSPLDRLKTTPSLRIAIIGQADPRPLSGRPYTNLGLSSLRAASIGDYLVQNLGVDPDQVIVMGLGAAEEWLPVRKPGESRTHYYSRCRRILIMYSEAGNQELLEKVRRIE